MNKLTAMEEDAFTSAWERWVDETPSILKNTGVKYVKRDLFFNSHDDYLTSNKDDYYKEMKVQCDTDIDKLRDALKEEWADEIDEDLIMSTSAEGLYEISRDIFDRYCGKYMEEQIEEMEMEDLC